VIFAYQWEYQWKIFADQWAYQFYMSVLVIDVFYQKGLCVIFAYQWAYEWKIFLMFFIKTAFAEPFAADLTENPCTYVHIH